ncbi:MAG: hypothetical protein ACNI26_13220 [Terasakiella sp.]|uniref:hypothetical protein n=1 Tax=unclassified Terasakiella TaxID=2614952 RepID=UPI003B0036F9
MIGQVKTMLEDDRPILAAYFSEEDYSKVGECGVTKIIAYGENGHMATIPWLAVYIGDDIARRIPAQMVEIVYDPDFFEVP